MLDHFTAASDAVYLASFNPFDGVTPTFGPFEPLLSSKIGMFLGLAWALGFCYTAYNLIISVSRLSQARKGGYGDTLDDAKSDTMKVAAATVGLAAMPVIYGVLVSTS